MPANTTEQAHESPIAGVLCLLGFFLHIILSEPLLNAVGLHYSGDNGRFYEKIHPGSLCIILAFIVLLWRHKNPLAETLFLFTRHQAFSVLLGIYVMLLFYMTLRSGPQGLAFIIDTHMVVPMAALTLCYAPKPYCQKSIHLFIIIAAVNSGIGIIEAMERTRLFTFDPSWSVLKEPYFRSSALLGHPLNNALFTVIALFIALSLHYPYWLKICLITIFMISLVAFGGRAALISSIIGLLILGGAGVKGKLSDNTLTLLQIWLYLIAAMLLPLCFLLCLYLVIGSEIGERIATHFWWDNSAESRMLALNVFNYMSIGDILVGVSPAHIMYIDTLMNQKTSISDIENPWILICMNLGIIGFCVWFTATLAFIAALMRRQPLALQLTVLLYFIIASSSNSFGRKDSIYVIMTIAVICASRSLIVRSKPCSSAM